MPKGKNISERLQAGDRQATPFERGASSSSRFSQATLKKMYETADLPPAQMQMMEQLVFILGVFDQWTEAAQGGDEKAIMSLCLAAKLAVAGLEVAGEDNVRKYAQSEPSWPVLMMPGDRAPVVLGSSGDF